jgi:hypothetical protein
MKNIMFLFLLAAGICTAQTSYEVNGVFIVDQVYYTDSVGDIAVNNGVSAYFTDSPSAQPDFSKLISAGSVSFNDRTLASDPTLNAYSDVGVHSVSEKNWQVEGSDAIPQMSFSYEGNLPGFDATTLNLADTVHRYDTLFIQLDGVHEADSIHILLIDNPDAEGAQRVGLMAPNYANMFYIVPAALSNLGLSTNAVIKIEAVNYSYQTIEDKLFLFRNISSYVKNNVVIVD